MVESQRSGDMGHFLSLPQLADETGIRQDTLRKLAKAQEIPAGKLGGTWIFVREDIEKVIRGQYRVGDDQMALHQTLGEKQCKNHLQSASTIEGADSITASGSTASEYGELLNL